MANMQLGSTETDSKDAAGPLPFGRGEDYAGLAPLRQSTGDRAYHGVARLLRGIRACHQRLGTSEEFSDI
ncbi:hypothetical protein QQY24_30115 [Streptomyces sp. TG1A-8]|uniref:hypothetical protein n=1 Tax=Streptomyces sp. TG1A-8 TaxID=3051385 RepID=UPI00265C0F19|nr:hypothetical protein [Streptomyces sp. TG1A-8]MDO0929458.1 hypothetical protein [Streptomyces sp. TG1A-8]